MLNKRLDKLAAAPKIISLPAKTGKRGARYDIALQTVGAVTEVHYV
jgi:hypothetical protein